MPCTYCLAHPKYYVNAHKHQISDCWFVKKCTHCLAHPTHRKNAHTHRTFECSLPKKCSHCLAHPTHRVNAHTHSTSNCWILKATVKPKTIRGSNSSSSSTLCWYCNKSASRKHLASQHTYAQCPFK